MGKGVMLRGKEQENIYPVTSSDLVYDPVTKKNVKEELGGKVEEAPKDGEQYARLNGAWAKVEAGAVSETALISLTPALSELNGVSVMVTTSEGETVLDTTWNGATLSCQIRAGLQYTVAVGAKDGFIAPQPITYTAERGVTRTINMAYVESKLTVNILSNQENDATIAAVKATVKYGTTTVEVANGQTIALPQDVSVTISFPAVANYKAPSAITYTHSGGDIVKSGTYQTEIVRVILSASNGASVSGQKVTINGVAHTYGSTPVEQKVAFGTTYTVSVDDMDGFTTPASVTFTADRSLRNLELVYEMVKYGVFIQATDGSLVSADNWNGSKTANGIAVITGFNQDFVLSLHDANSECEWGETGKLVTGIFTSEDPEAWGNDFDGVGNTQKIVDQLLGTSDVIPAAYYCQNYTFPNGKKGYLPTAAEWWELRRNLSEITEALDVVGGTPIVHAPWTYWVSSQASADEAWNWYVDAADYFTKAPKNYKYIARPFTTL